ncbi:MAG: hypothetical protein SXA11_21115 [Cyanobacteriota bacterium]|nr:hypothetical protein [Cyanobacteriota bacterium]
MTRTKSSQANSAGQGRKIKNLFSNWPKSNLLRRTTATMTLVALTVGCGAQPQEPRATNCQPVDLAGLEAAKAELTPQSANNSQECLDGECDFNKQAKKSYQPARADGKQLASTNCARIDPFNESVKYALQGSRLAQSAVTKEDWDEVAAQWVQAVAWMQAVPPNSPKRAFAEKKVLEYMRNLAYSQQKAAEARAQIPSFNSDLLDRQLELYLSYIETIGTPDVLIVGSSRAVQGVDPAQMQQVLAARGLSGLKIFNFGINGATAQVVDFQLRKLLTPDQLPKLIIWADGVRAFNNARVDKTYNAIASSEGSRLLAAGVRPQLPSSEYYYNARCYQFPSSCKALLSQKLPYSLPSKELLPPALAGEYSEVAMSKDSSIPRNPVSDGENVDSQKPGFSIGSGEPLVVADATLEEIARAIDANGFLSVSTRFNPSSYYRRRPYVAGRYDRDYAGLYLGGRQGEALRSVLEFVNSRGIPLVFVNLPLTDGYLDSVRWSADKQFAWWMQGFANRYGFDFINLNLSTQLARNDYFVDPSHLNRYGARAVARALASDRSIPWPR